MDMHQAEQFAGQQGLGVVVLRSAVNVNSVLLADIASQRVVQGRCGDG